MIAALLLLAALQSHAPLPPAEAAPAAEKPVLQVKGADIPLLESVRTIASKVEELRGQKYDRPPIAVRAPEMMRQLAGEIRVLNTISRERLAARGRAWADIGLGSPSSPAVLMRVLSEDLAGVGFDAEGNRLLVSPELLTEEDFTFSEDAPPESTVLMATGVRVDEPLVGHLLVHVRQMERTGQDFMAPTTDSLLARSAMAEGEANLVAVRYLFEGLGLEDEILGSRLDPGSFLEGRLVPSSLGSISRVERDLAMFAYGEGFARAVEHYLDGGWAAVGRAMGAAGSTTAILHPERADFRTEGFPEPEPPREGFELVDEDILGEQGIIVLVSVLSGKDNLGLMAGDGWAGDRLYRWEPPGSGGEGRGITRWVTRWQSEEDAADFDYAIWRTLKERFPGREPQEMEQGGTLLTGGDRTFLFERNGIEARLTISPAADRATGGVRP
jgi:hypothetical protein